MDRLIKDRQHQLDRLKSKRKVLVRYKGGVNLTRALRITEATPKFPVRDDSEVSYEHLTSRRGLELSLLYLHKNFWWSLLVTNSACFMYYLISFGLVYHEHFMATAYEYLFLHVFCYLILLIDSVISLLGRWMKSNVGDEEAKGRSLALSLVNFILLISPEAIEYTLEGELQMIAVFLSYVRACMKLIYFFFTVYDFDIMHNAITCACKYYLAMNLLIHTFAIMWKLCAVHRKQKYPFEDYITPHFFVIGAIGNIGYRFGSGTETLEQIILIVASLIGAFLIQGNVMNLISSILFDSYRVSYKHLLRMKLINRMMSNNKIPGHIVNEVAALEEKYLKNKLIQSEPLLYKELPAPLKVEVSLDKYWYALQKSFFFEKAMTHLKEEVVMIMKTAVYNKGESIYETGCPMHMMAFIASGSVSVETVDESDTPLFTLGVGSCIGALNLIYTTNSKFELRAASFCLLHTLSKSDFWRYFMKKCKKLGTKDMFVNIANMKIQEAKDSRTPDKTRVTLAEAVKKLPFEEDIWKYNVSTENNNAYTKSRFCDFQLHDKIFIRTEWPWIFHPHTDLIRYWNYFQASLVVLVAVTYPYYICFKHGLHYPDYFIWIQMNVSLFYLLDIVVQFLTAVESNEGMVTTIEGIIRIRLSSYKFICELIGAFPTEILYYLFLSKVESVNYIRMFKLVKLLKLIKIPHYLSTLESSCFGINLVIMKTCKYMIYIFYLVYLMAAFWFRYYCNFKVCADGSYIKTYLHRNADGFYKLVISMLWITCPFTKSGESGISTSADIYITIGLCILGNLFYIYLCSDLWATESVANLSRAEYCAMTEGLIAEMRSCNMDRTTISRIEEYLMLQWVHYNGILEDDLVNDLPAFVQYDIKNVRFLDYLRKVPFFEDLDTDILQMLTKRINTHFLPPNELVTYEGQMVRDLFIVEKGFVEVVCSNSKSVVKILGPKDSFCLIEMLLKKPSYFTYRTSTHVSILKLSRIHILMEVFSQYHTLAYTVNTCIDEMAQSTAVQRLFRHKRIVLNVKSVEYEGERSWFTFSTQKRDPLCMDYDNQLRNSKLASRLCKLMMRSTILPSGKFILYYERFHAIVVLTMCMYIPLMHFYSVYWIGIFYSSIIFDFLQLLDMYIRLHVCYYNKKGILVSHPKSTSIHYLKSSFLVDVLSFIPFEKILYLDRVYVSRRVTLSTLNMLCYNRLLAMYRYRFLFYQKSKVVKTTFWKLLLKQMPILCLVINILVTVYMFCMTDVVLNDKDSSYIVIKNNTWLRGQHYFHKRKETVFEVHVDSTYLVMMMFYNCKFISFTIRTPQLGDAIFMCILLLLGYFYFAFLTAQILLVQTKLDSTLMLNQSYLAAVKRKLAKMNLKGLHKEIQKYFTCIWKHAQSINSRKTVAMLHDALQEDYLIRFHAEVLQKVVIFDDDAPQVSRILGKHFTNVYFPDNSIIININDIVDFVYIIRKGEVRVSTAGNKYDTTLQTGSMFGNIDSVSYTRSMVKYQCTEPVDLWCIKTELMYKLIKEVPFITARLNKHICLKCLSYIKNRPIIKLTAKKAVKEEVLTISMRKWNKVSKILASHYIGWMFTILSYFSVNWTIYVLAFRESNKYNGLYLAIFIFFDVMCFFQILYNFYLPHLNQQQQQQRAFRLYLTIVLPLLVISLLPFELIILYAMSKNYSNLQDFGRLNRLLRLVSCYWFFNCKYTSINVNAFLLDLLWMFSHILLFIHGWACIFFYISCPNHKCHKESWVYKPVIGLNGTKTWENICRDYYTCSLYYSSAVFTKTPFRAIRPMAIFDRSVFIFMIFCSSILHMLVVAQIFQMSKHSIYSGFAYIYNTQALKNYLSYSMLSPTLLHKVYKYVFSLWTYCKGQQVPEFVELLPKHLKTSYKMRLYGHHIYQSPLFELCHLDFTRQIIEKLQVQVYFEGHTICRQGEVNETLYFVEKGNIEVCEVNDTEIIVIDELREGDTFGIVQGLFNCVPHKFTFTATSLTVLVTLTKGDWDYLLTFFPASEYFTYKNFVAKDDSEVVQKDDVSSSNTEEEDEDSLFED